MPKVLTAIGKIALLLCGMILSVLATLLIAWRSYTCASMAYFNASVPPIDAGSHLMRRLAYERICNLTDFFSGGFVFFLGLVISMIAWHSLRNPQPSPQH